jgi:maleate isomerase
MLRERVLFDCSEFTKCHPPKKTLTMPTRIRLGVIVPSSNTILEPMIQKIVASINDPALDITVHYSRFRVTRIELSQHADSQFALDAMHAAAQLLADARVDVIGWAGTSSSWLGFSTDEILCASIEARTGIPATTSVLAMNNILRQRGSRSIGLITPYLEELNVAIRTNYRDADVDIPEERSRCSGLSTNFDFAELREPELDAMMRDVVRHGAESVLVMCTNVAAAQRAKYWEDRYKVSVLDSVAAVVHGMLQKLEVQVDSTCMEEWGTVFNYT